MISVPLYVRGTGSGEEDIVPQPQNDLQSISVSEAISAVRKNLDEIDPNDSVMYSDEGTDNLSVSDIISRNLPEAINAVCMAAPVTLLEGTELSFEGSTSVEVSSEGVVYFDLPQTSRFMRLVAFQASDSPIVVTDVIPEASPEGRKQKNRHIRGTYDRPRLVQVQGVHSGPAFRYYSLKTASEYEEDPASAIRTFSYVEEQKFSPRAEGYSYPRRLRQNIIDLLTASVMEIYNDQRAQVFIQKANNFATI